MSDERTGLTLVVPVHNEREGIGDFLARLGKVRAEADFDIEIILVDDGSTDGTSDILDGAGASLGRVIRHRERRGYGASLKSGIRHAVHDAVAIIDADGSYPPEALLPFYREFRSSGVEMLVGHRQGQKGASSPLRMLAKAFLRRLAGYLVETKIPDINSGLRVMRRKTVEAFIPILPNGFSFTTTITLAMLANAYEVSFAHVDYLARKGHSKIRPVHDVVNFFQLIIRTTLFFNPLKIFLPASFFFLGTSLMMLIYRVVFGSGFLVTAVIFFICGIQLLGLGMLADLIDRRLK